MPEHVTDGESAFARATRTFDEQPQLVTVFPRLERKVAQPFGKARELAQREPEGNQHDRRRDDGGEADHRQDGVASIRKPVSENRVDDHRGGNPDADREPQHPRPDLDDEAEEKSAGARPLRRQDHRLEVRHAISPWMRPLASLRRPPPRPARTAMISASIDNAVSAGVCAPMSRPAGPLMRSSSDSPTPASSNRSRRRSWLRR